MRRKKNRHLVEIAVVLFIFAIMAVANALSSSDFSESVGRKIAEAQARYEAGTAENLADVR